MKKLSQTGCSAAENRIHGVLAVFDWAKCWVFFCGDSGVEMQKFFRLQQKNEKMRNRYPIWN